MVRRVLMLLLLLMLSAAPMFSEQSRMEQIVSLIEPQMWYLGSDVRVALLDLMTIAQEEIKTTSEEAVRVAVEPILLNSQKLQRQVVRLKWTIGISAGVIAVSAGVVAGVLLFK